MTILKQQTRLVASPARLVKIQFNKDIEQGVSMKDRAKCRTNKTRSFRKIEKRLL